MRGSGRGTRVLVSSMGQVNMAAKNLAIKMQERKIPVFYGQFDRFSRIILTW